MKRFGISLIVITFSLLSTSLVSTHRGVHSSSTYVADGVVPPPPPSCPKGCTLSSPSYFADGVVPPPPSESLKASNALAQC